MKNNSLCSFISKLNKNDYYWNIISIDNKAYLVVLDRFIELYSIKDCKVFFIHYYSFYCNSKGLYFNFKRKRFYL